MFVNTADNKAWIRFDAGIVELDTIAGYPSFSDLVDTPASYIGSSGKLLAVNGSESGLEFIENTTVTSITDLSDTPAKIEDDKVLVSSITSDDFSYENYISYFSQLLDVESYSGNAFNLYRINYTEDGLESIDGSTLFADLTSAQRISGIKTFSSEVICSDTLTINSDIDLNGNIINDLIIDTDLIGALDTNIPSTLAVKTYIDNIVITAVGGSYVSLTGNETVEGVKTFSDNTIFSSDISVTGDTSTYNIIQDISSYHYFGSESVDGSYRMFVNPAGDLEIQKRETGNWVYKANF
jgi:hypothetical protein